MKRKKLSSFIAVLPMVVACAKDNISRNPPEPVVTKNPPLQPESTSTPATKPEIKDPMMKFPPAAYSKREKKGDGKCYVQIYANPPYQVEVSCTAEIELPASGSKWCQVELAKDSSKKTSVDCGDVPPPPPPPPPPAYFPKREKTEGGICYVAMAGNPPYKEEVSCTETPKPHNNGGCLLELKRTPGFTVVVDCKS